MISHLVSPVLFYSVLSDPIPWLLSSFLMHLTCTVHFLLRQNNFPHMGLRKLYLIFPLYKNADAFMRLQK